MTIQQEITSRINRLEKSLNRIEESLKAHQFLSVFIYDQITEKFTLLERIKYWNNVLDGAGVSMETMAVTMLDRTTDDLMRCNIPTTSFENTKIYQAKMETQKNISSFWLRIMDNSEMNKTYKHLLY